jgi:hypothetical protein
MSDPQVSQVNQRTGEMVPYIDGAPAPLALDEMRQMLGYVEDFVKSILKEGEDYARVPGTDRSSLLQPGAEKIKFAFSLADEYTTLERHVEPDREWTYRTFDKRTQTEVERKARGYFRYEVRCDLVHRKSGVIWGSCVGVCESSERGRENAPANTIIKMAQKRAMVGAAKSVAFLSGRFTCDVEDLQGDQAVHHRSDAEALPEGCSAAMTSRGDQSGKLGFCWTCNRRHIKAGDQIVKDAAEGKWHSRECWEKAHTTKTEPESEQGPMVDPEPDRPMEPAKPAERKFRSVYQQAADGEDKYVSLFTAEEQDVVRRELGEARLEFLKAKITGEPCGEVSMATPATVVKYVEWLANSVTAKQAQGA